ncbi:MAG: hypothetical protein LBK60_01905 [Verrucomicrobiales bacterium]|nr:hypothetical protein [Verrucomicrobiales bacterium]
MSNALRDYCIAKLSAGHPQRRWLELTQIYTYIGSDHVGRIYSGQKSDFVTLLKNFIADNDQDAPALVAHYSLLFDTQGKMSRRELIHQCASLLADIKQANPANFPDLFKIAKYTKSTQNLARLADGDTTAEYWGDHWRGDYGDEMTADSQDWKPYPHTIRLTWKKEQKIPCLNEFTRWFFNEAQSYSCVPPEDKIKEAQAAILFNSKGSFRAVPPDEWLAQFSNSIAMTTWVAGQSLYEHNATLGLPIQYPFNGKEEQASYQRQINYTANGLKFWLERVDSEQQLNQLENSVSQFIFSLTERAFIEIVSDQQYTALQKQLAECVEKAGQRIGRQRQSNQLQRYIPWQTLTREQAERQHGNELFNFIRYIFERGFFEQQLTIAEANANSGKFNPADWWKLLRSEDMHRAFTQSELAEFYLKFKTQTFEKLDSGDFNSKEFGFLYEQALTLLHGGRYLEAEAMLEKIQHAPVTDLNRGYTNNLVKANAAFCRAQIHRMNRRFPEAVQQAQLALQLSNNETIPLIKKRYDEKLTNGDMDLGVSGDLARQSVRLLKDLRFDPQRANLPEQVRVISVPTPNMDNPELRIFYRVPSAADGDQPRRVLVLGAGSNAENLSYLRLDSAWAKFADAHNLVVVMPQFKTSSWAWQKNDTYSYYIAAQVWSGQALLDGLAQINQQCAIQKEQLLFYTYASGSGFPLRFARWRPDLVAAVAVGRPSNLGCPRLAEPGLRPFSALKKVAFHISASEFDDDCRYNHMDRYATAVHFATLLQAADVQVEWKNYPDLTPPTVLELEQDAREFLARQLKP